MNESLINIFWGNIRIWSIVLLFFPYIHIFGYSVGNPPFYHILGGNEEIGWKGEGVLLDIFVGEEIGPKAKGKLMKEWHENEPRAKGDIGPLGG